MAEVSKIANYRRLVAVNHGSQSKSTDGSKSGWRQRSVVVVVIVVTILYAVVFFTNICSLQFMAMLVGDEVSVWLMRANFKY